jgi:type VI secretion system protein VasD
MRALVLAALFLSGCSLLPWGDSKPGPLRITVVAGKRLNPDDQGQSLPTAVRVYQLASVGKAVTVELLDLLREPKASLGDDLLGVEELLVQPGERVERTIAREKEAHALLVVGLFRRPTGSGWKQLVELPGRGSASVGLSIDEYRLERR